tara:strand:+ start:2876 stop:3688 length:813 start_codon:yes stop_codon:yes gene_type:complete
MITTELYNGQGPGDQTWVYLMTRYLAHKLDYDFGISNPERWKLTNLNINFGNQVTGGESPEGGPPRKLPDGIENYYVEVKEWHPGFRDCNLTSFDPGVFDIKDNTKLEGYFHYSHLLEENSALFSKWLDFDSVISRNPVVKGKVICNIRGGEYRGVPDLILPKSYWDMALERLGNPEVEIVTDDPSYALSLIPHGKIFNGNMIEHFENLFTAEKLVISNSAFAFFPAALGLATEVIAPKYWSRYNVSDGFWAMEGDKHDGFTYIDRDGNE